ncbi:MAG: ABC transporter substrate-binding protein [Rhodobacteraceae bacterium]|nr:ABC transporter substrate-binding protein [Paracoccaceae bacterium]
MHARSNLTRRGALGAAALGCALALAPLTATAQTDIRFTLDWNFEGPAAGFFLAIDNGHFAAEGLNVTIDTGAGSRESIPRVATGTYPMGFGDINALAKFLDEDPSQKITAVMVIYDVPPFAIIGRASRGITPDPMSLEGKVLGAPPTDGAFGQWPAFVDVTGLDTSTMTIESVGFPVREPMLAQGQVDAIFGFSFSSVLNLKAQGIPEDDIVPILMVENGLDLYGNAIMVNTDFAESNPEAVRGFLRALGRGFADAVADPGAGVAAVMRRNQILTREIELERLGMAIDMNIRTPWVQENGLGGIDEERMARAMEQLTISMELKGNVTIDRLFDASYLAPASERMLP